MDRIDTGSEVVEHSEASWLFAQPGSEGQAITPTMLSGAYSIEPHKVRPKQSLSRFV